VIRSPGRRGLHACNSTSPDAMAPRFPVCMLVAFAAILVPRCRRHEMPSPSKAVATQEPPVAAPSEAPPALEDASSAPALARQEDASSDGEKDGDAAGSGGSAAAAALTRLRVLETNLRMGRLFKSVAQRKMSCDAAVRWMATLGSDVQDSWGRRMQLECDNEQLRIMSAGPDGHWDTRDDLGGGEEDVLRADK